MLLAPEELYPEHMCGMRQSPNLLLIGILVLGWRYLGKACPVALGKGSEVFLSVFDSRVSLSSWNIVQEPVQRKKSSKACQEALALCFEGVGGLLCQALVKRKRGATSAKLSRSENVAHKERYKPTALKG